MKRWVASAVAPLLLAQAPTASLDLSIDGVRNANGHVLVEICTEADFLKPICPWRGGVAAKPGQVKIRLVGVPPGVYAAQAFHDENDNMDIDRNWLGIPTEGLGFSRDAPFRFGPPRFEDAAFRLGRDDASIGLTLRYFDWAGGRR